MASRGAEGCVADGAGCCARTERTPRPVVTASITSAETLTVESIPSLILVTIQFRDAERQRARGCPRARCIDYRPPLLEGEADATRRDEDVVRILRRGPRRRVTHRIAGEQVTAGEVERQARRKPIRRGQVDFGAEV